MHESLQLRLDIGRRRCRDILQTLGQAVKFRQYLRQQAGDFIDQQNQARLAFRLALGERGGVQRQRILQASDVERLVDDLLAQLFLRTQGHELHAHLLQARDAFLDVFDLLLHLQREQAAQTDLVRARGHGRVVKHFQVAMRALVDQRGEADQGQLALHDFEQLR